MSLSQAVLHIAQQHTEDRPITAKELKAQFPEKSTTQVSVALRDHWIGARLQRKQIGVSITNQPRYAYYYDAGGHSDVAKAPQVSQAAQPAPKFAAQIDTYVSDFANSIVDAIVAQLKPLVEERLRAALPKALPPIPHIKAPQVEKSRPMKVGITGLLPAQAQTIAQEFGDAFDLKFWNGKTGDGREQLKSMGIGCQVVFHHVDHAGHATEATLKSVGAKIVRVPGGLTNLRDALTRLYVEGAV